jgi:hypothetical protein
MGRRAVNPHSKPSVCSDFHSGARGPAAGRGPGSGRSAGGAFSAKTTPIVRRLRGCRGCLEVAECAAQQP